MASSHQFHDLRVADVRPDADDAVVITFEVPPALRELFAYTQGQHLTLRRQISGRDTRRCYSICAGLDDGALRVGIRKVEGGIFSSWCTTELKRGDVISVMPPQGSFFTPLAPRESRHHLGLAGGSGITPILSILKTVMTREPRSTFTLIYANRRLATTMFRGELEDLAQRHPDRLAVQHVFSQEPGGEIQGRLDREALQRMLLKLAAAKPIDHAYICGPHQLNDEAVAALRATGMPEAGIHVEKFGLPLDASSAVLQDKESIPDKLAAVVKVRLDEQEFELEFGVDDSNILDCALSAGVELPFGCAMGVCGSCRAHVVQGSVAMGRHNVLTADELERGVVLTCQARPTTQHVVLSFDEGS